MPQNTTLNHWFLLNIFSASEFILYYLKVQCHGILLPLCWWPNSVENFKDQQSYWNSLFFLFSWFSAVPGKLSAVRTVAELSFKESVTIFSTLFFHQSFPWETGKKNCKYGEFKNFVIEHLSVNSNRIRCWWLDQFQLTDEKNVFEKFVSHYL